jgi:hypothetical protein
LNLAAGRRHAEEFTAMGAVVSLVGGHAVAIGKLPMDVCVKVRECGPKYFVELSRAILIRRTPRLRGVIEKVVSEELLEHCEIPAALHFFGVTPNHCFRGFA